MKFSVIIPVYNVEQYIGQCVNSVLNQCFDDYEIILVDDGSTDASGRICDRFSNANSNVVVIHKKNGGLSDARNHGVRKAKGDYILFVDSDDYISENSLCQINECISANKYPDIVCLECVKFLANSSTVIPMNDGVSEKINSLREDELYEYIAHLNKLPGSACTKAINTDFFVNNDLFFEVGRLSEDLEWATRLFINAKRIAYCSAPYYNYRQSREGSISATANEKNMMHIMDAIRKNSLLAQKEVSVSKKRMIYSFSEYMYRTLILGYTKIKDENKLAYRKELEKYKYVFGVRKDKSSRMIRTAYKLLGIKNTSMLLNVYLNVARGRSSSSGV